MTFRYLGLRVKTAREWLTQLQVSSRISLPVDFYNCGESVKLLEKQTADILKKSSALFFPKGMAAQFAMLKCNENQRNNRNIAIHPLSHIAWDEAQAHKTLLNLNPVLIGSNDSPFYVDDLEKIETPVATCIVEIPLRRAGFRLLEWKELEKISDWAKSNSVHLHMDGARLWEACLHYGRPEHEVAALFDSVYVSFYKGLGGMGGSVLAGDHDFIEECKIWRTRLANDYFTSFPLVLTALQGLKENRSKLAALRERAITIANLLENLDGLNVRQPQTNGFIVFLDREIDTINHVSAKLSKKYGIQLYKTASKYPNSNKTMIELQVGHEHHLISDDEIRNYFQELLNQTLL